MVMPPTLARRLEKHWDFLSLANISEKMKKPL
jgi:hypothetical protein